ncbi:hypothetical protein BAMA_22965 [Bacillus manliponensis]|uniref:HNH endonuclease n=1 Tax=Bacillus manliponensis TaxID=574376 RepID=A0A073JY69_9BACI|nr:hypothetical protein [Bacillus manliponensis]KEK19246.1 hypothetical protein BAMA_22965 [Bacillus manliponensis]
MSINSLPNDELVGKKVGRLTILGVFKQLYTSGRTQIKYSCICDCNTDHLVYIKRDDLIHKRRIHCGCLRKEPTNKYKNRKYAILKHYYNSSLVKRSSKKRFTEIIDFDIFVLLVQQPCVFCGDSYSCILKDRFSSEQIKCNTIDRLNNNLGYVPGNCVPCCVKCNIAKGERTLEQFIQWILNLNKNIYEVNTDVSL